MTQVEVEKLEKSKVKVKIQASSEQLKEAIKKAAQKISQDVKVAGFRPGKVPVDILEKKVGRENILSEATEILVRKTLWETIEKKDLEIIDKPQIKITKIAWDNPLEYEAVFFVMPEVALGDYKTVKGKKKEVKVEENEIEVELQKLSKMRTKSVRVQRAIAKGDVAEINFEIRVNGVKIEGGESKNHPVTVGENHFIPGFEDNLVGLKENEEKTFKVAFPKNYPKKDYAGKEAEAKVRVNVVMEQQKPKIDDVFAKELGNFKNLKDLKKSIEDGLKVEKNQKERDALRAKLIEGIEEKSKMEIPDILIESEIDKMVAEIKANAQKMGLTFEKYLEIVKKDEKNLKKDLEKNAIKRVRTALVLREISKKERVEPTEKEVGEELNKILKQYPNEAEVKKSLDLAKIREFIKGMLANEKVFTILEKRAEENSK
jgi:trigger factor